MSGITGIINFDNRPVSQELLVKMTEQVAYRGPDGISYLRQSGVGFAYLALHSTSESEFERQPLVHPETGIMLVADARVDNRVDLIRKLALPQRKERPVTDAELIMAAYLRWGVGAAKYIIGDFAFLLWDPRNRGVYAARDPMGIRNLHFAFTGRTLLVASEAQQILQYPTISNALNESAVIEWAIGRVSSRYCMFKDIEVLQAGRCLWADADDHKIVQFWDIDPSRCIRYKRVPDYAKHFIEVLSTAVEVRLRSRTGVVGAELSGGMDSTTIVALAKRNLDRCGGSLMPISYQYPDTPSCDETVHIESVTGYLSMKTHYVNAEAHGALAYPQSYRHTLESPWVRDYPFMDPGLRFLQEQGAEVLLTGNGGDEVTMGGYLALQHRLFRGDLRVLSDIVRYCRQQGLSIGKTSYHAFLEPHIAGSVDRMLRRLLRKKVRNRQACPAWVTPSAIERLNLIKRYYSPLKRRQFPNIALQSMYDNLIEGSSPGGYGAYELMASRYQMEARHPFLDQNVIEFCFAIPVSLWNRQSYPKWLLRVATKDLLPDDVRWRTDKTVATEVFGKGIGNNLDYIRNVLAYNNPQLIELYDSGILKQEFDAHFRDVAGIERGDIDFALSLQCWLYTNRNAFEC